MKVAIRQQPFMFAELSSPPSDSEKTKTNIRTSNATNVTVHDCWIHLSDISDHAMSNEGWTVNDRCHNIRKCGNKLVFYVRF